MKVHMMIQYSPEWWEVRRGIPTASAFDRILTPGGKLSGQSDGYIDELVGDAFCLNPNFMTERPMNHAMRAGLEAEPEARRFYEMENPTRTVQQVGFCLTDDGRFGCSPDALVGDDGVLELKCPQAKTQVGYLRDGTLPSEYRPQVHGHLLVTGRPWVDFCSYCPGLPPLVVKVMPDEFTVKLRNALEAFHDTYLKVLQEIKTKGGV